MRRGRRVPLSGPPPPPSSACPAGGRRHRAMQTAGLDARIIRRLSPCLAGSRTTSSAWASTSSRTCRRLPPRRRASPPASASPPPPSSACPSRRTPPSSHADRWPRRAYHHLRGVHSRARLGRVQHPRPGPQPARGHAEGCRQEEGRRRRPRPLCRRPPRHARAGGRRHRAHADRWPRRALILGVHSRARLGRDNTLGPGLNQLEDMQKAAAKKKGVAAGPASPPPPSSACPSRRTPPPSSCRPLASTRASSSSGPFPCSAGPHNILGPGLNHSRTWKAAAKKKGVAAGLGLRRRPMPERADAATELMQTAGLDARDHHLRAFIPVLGWVVQHPRPGSQPARGHAEGCRQEEVKLPLVASSP